MNKLDGQKNIDFIILSTFLLVLLIAHQFYFLVSDDFIRGFSAQGSLSDIFETLKKRYFGWTGRIWIDFLNILVMKWDVYLWRVLNPLVIVVLVWFVYVIVRDGESDPGLFLFVIALFCLMTISVSRDVISWLTGSFNYLWPMALVVAVFAGVYEFYYHNGKDVLSWRSYFLLPLALLAGSSHEQAGIAILLLLGMLLFWLRVFQKVRLHRLHIFVFISALVGFLLLMTAPGNFVRMGISDNKPGRDLLPHIIEMGYTIFIGKDFERWHLLLFSFLFPVAIKVKDSDFGIRWLNKVIPYIYGVLLLALLYASTGGEQLVKELHHFIVSLPFVRPDDISKIIYFHPFVPIVFVVNIVLCFYFSLVYCFEKKQPLFFIVLVTAFIVQAMMVFVSASPPRTYFPSFPLLWIAVGVLYKRNENESLAFIPLLLFIGLNDKGWVLPLVATVSVLIIAGKRLLERCVVSRVVYLLFLLISFSSFLFDHYFYYRNAYSHRLNLKAIDAVQQGRSEKLFLYELYNKIYFNGYEHLPGPPGLSSLKEYYDFDEDLEYQVIPLPGNRSN